jgi:hypothetical protein
MNSRPTSGCSLGFSLTPFDLNSKGATGIVIEKQFLRRMFLPKKDGVTARVGKTA